MINQEKVSSISEKFSCMILWKGNSTMRPGQGCIECMLRKERKRSDDPEYLAEVEKILSDESNLISAPYLSWLFSQAAKKRIGEETDYTEIKKQYNDLVLSRSEEFRTRIEASDDPFRRALEFSRVGNYIDFAVMDTVDPDTFLSLFENSSLREEETEVYRQFRKECTEAESFLLCADNCGEIVLDLFLIEQLKKLNPEVSVSVMVRSGHPVNDATIEDAEQIGLDRIAEILTVGIESPGVVREKLSGRAKEVFDSASVVLAKGQGNYEGISGAKRPVCFTFLCKCDVFADRFKVPKLTGMIIRETGGVRDL